MEFRYGKNVSQNFIENKLQWDEDNEIKKTAKKVSRTAKIKVKHCYLCRNSRSKKECSFYGINYLKCKNCSLVYADRRLSEEQLQNYYENDTHYDAKASYADKKLLKIREEIVKPKIMFMKKYAKGKNWLDVGSADGSALTVIKKESFNPVGIELNESSRIFAKKHRRIDLYPKSLSSFVKESKLKFNVISFFGVLDLIPDPINELKLSNKLLNKNGIVGINVPNFDSFSTQVQKLITSPARHLEPSSMLMQYNQKSLEFALKKSGFKPLATWYFGMDMIEFLKYIRSKINNFNKSETDATLIHQLNAIQTVFDTNHLGDQIFMIGQKISN